MIYALIKDNVVVSIQALDPESAKVLQDEYLVMDITDIKPPPQVGWTLDRDVLSGPAPVQTWLITRLALRLRFTVPEVLGIMTMASGTTQQSLMVKMVMDNNNVAEYIDLRGSTVSAALGLLVSYGLITSQRATVILTTPPAPAEVYKVRL